jgi:excinuclease UvrABC ATPase subunit
MSWASPCPRQKEKAYPGGGGRPAGDQAGHRIAPRRFHRNGAAARRWTGTGGDSRWRSMIFSAQHACIDCGLSYPEVTPRMFSFNNPHGACPDCSGLGTRMLFDREQVVPNPGAVPARRRCGSLGQPHRLLLSGACSRPWPCIISSTCAPLLIKLTQTVQDVILYGSGATGIRFFLRSGRQPPLLRKAL